MLSENFSEKIRLKLLLIVQIGLSKKNVNELCCDIEEVVAVGCALYFFFEVFLVFAKT